MKSCNHLRDCKDEKVTSLKLIEIISSKMVKHFKLWPRAKGAVALNTGNAMLNVF